jgi:hypothetical protein
MLLKQRVSMREAMSTSFPLTNEVVPVGRITHESGCVAEIISSEVGGWQTAHYLAADQLYGVHKGWAAVVTQFGGSNIKVAFLRQGDSFIIRPEYRHALYVAAGAIVVHTKFGDCTGELMNDFDLNRSIRSLSEDDLFNISGARDFRRDLST